MKKNSYAWITICVILITVISYDLKEGYWDDYQKVIYWDVLSYYAYLPAIYVYNDITLSFITENPTLFGDKFWPQGTPTGKFAIKTTMGLSLLYAPFFFVAHPMAQMLGYEANGFSPPYKMALTFGGAFYLMIGLIFLRKVLANFFSDSIVALTLISVTLGTNLLHYSTAEATMPHVYDFTLFSIFLYICIKWHQRYSLGDSILLGLISGLIVLIRPTNILILIIFILWGVYDLDSFGKRVLLFLKKSPLVLVMMASFIAVWIPQLLYWKFISGSYWFYSYGDERFFFLHPHIIKGLFGFRKGWLIYTPMMALALIGIAMMRKHLKGLFYPFLIFTLLNIYVVLSWWSWWYGGGFGLRAFIDSYSLLSIPFALLVSRALNGKVLRKAACISAIFLFLSLNLFQTWQYQRAIMHWDGMTAKAYWSIFLKTELPEDFEKLIDSPDCEKAQQGIES